MRCRGKDHEGATGAGTVGLYIVDSSIQVNGLWLVGICQQGPHVPRMFVPSAWYARLWEVQPFQ